MLVYALINQDGRIYVGQTADLKKRILDHNFGRVFSTKHYRPWTVLYTEEVSNRIAAREREKYYKHGVGKEFLKSKSRPL